jgi:hypothetical protein
MENLNLHKQKLYALIVAGVGLISIFLPWATVRFGNFGSNSANGLKGWEGIIALLGVIAVAVAALMEDKTKPFAGNMKMVAMGGFGLMALGAIVTLISSKGGQYGNIVKTGFGVYLCILAGAVGLLWVAGIIKLPENKPPAPPQS